MTCIALLRLAWAITALQTCTVTSTRRTHISDSQVLTTSELDLDLVLDLDLDLDLDFEPMIRRF